MTMNPETGQGYNAVEVRTEDYFDPNATDAAYPGALGLQIRKHIFWQGDVEFSTYETLGPVMGEGPNATIIVSGPGGTTALGQAAGEWGPNGEPPGSWTKPSSPGSVGGGFHGDTFSSGNIITEVPCDPDGIFGPMFGESDVYEIQILLQGVYGIGDLYFPVPPEELSGDFPQDNDGDTDTLAGEITIPGTEKLESIGWTGFFPRDYDPSYCVIPENSMQDPTAAIVGLIWSKRYRLPLKLIIGGTPWNDMVIIKSLKWTAKAGEPGDMYYDIQFKRYKTTSISTVVLPDAPSDPRDYVTYQGPPSPPATPPGGLVNPDRADARAAAAAQVTGDGTNSAVIPPDPTPGQPGFIGPLPEPPNSLDPYLPTLPGPISSKPSNIAVEDTYRVGVVGLIQYGRFGISSSPSGQTIAQVYEDIKTKPGGAELNSIESLKAINLTVSAENWVSLGPSPSTKHTVADYDPNSDPLPAGTPLKYWRLKANIGPTYPWINTNAVP